MRENMGLYRGKRKDNGEWIYGSFFYDDDVVTIFPNPMCIGCGFGGLWWIDDGFDPVERETVGQYIGMTDSNGNKVFEGDIVRITSGAGCPKPIVGAIHYERSGFFFKFGKDGSALFYDWAKQFYVIGNIHDNPELLEAANV